MQQAKSKRWKLTADQKELKKAGVKFYPPRKWKQGQKNTWLAKLREIIGKSQVQFAAMLGEEPKTIINIENGRTRLDGILAHKIQGATGVSAWQYMRGKNRPLDFSGKSPYTRAHFDYWKKVHSDNDEKSINRYAELASDTLLLMLRAAKKCGTPKNHLPALELSFYFWCAEAVKNFQLKPSLDEILKSERKYIKERTMSYHDWRRAEMSGDRNFYEFKDDPKKSDDELLTLRVEAHAGWSICGDMKVPTDGIQSEHFKMI
jgi:transcriptional regulator with XRE-family HTH domain